MPGGGGNPNRAGRLAERHRAVNKRNHKAQQDRRAAQRGRSGHPPEDAEDVEEDEARSESVHTPHSLTARPATAQPVQRKRRRTTRHRAGAVAGALLSDEAVVEEEEQDLIDADVEELAECWGHNATPEPPAEAEVLEGGGGLRQQDLDAALRFRAELERSLPTAVCAVCSCSVPPATTLRIPVSEIPNLPLLDAAVPATPKLPRSGITTFLHEGVRYCLQPLAIGPPSLHPSVQLQMDQVQAQQAAPGAGPAPCPPSALGSGSSTNAQQSVPGVGPVPSHQQQQQQQQQHPQYTPPFSRPAGAFTESTCAAVRKLQARLPAGTSLAAAAAAFLALLLQSLRLGQPHACYQHDRHLQHCLTQPAGVQIAAFTLPQQAAVASWAAVCASCHHALAAGRVPAASLVSIDAGSTAISRHDGRPLPPLTLVESLLVSPLRAMRNVIICKSATARQRPNDTFVRALQGHVVAFPNPPARALSSCFPQPLDQITDVIQVVLVHVARDIADVRAALQRSPALHVRGRHVVAWARHLAVVQQHHPLGPSQLLREYMELDGVPEQIVQAAVFAANDADARDMAAAFHSHRSGYTETRSSAASAAAAMGVPFVDPDHHIAANGNGSMHGLDDIELSWDPSGASALDEPDRLAGLAAHGNVFSTSPAARAAHIQQTLQQPSGVLASTTQRGQPANDYDPLYIPLVHITSFPYCTGGIPQGMSMKTWAKIILTRCPRPPCGNDSYLVLDIFNVLQRHEVNVQTSVHLRLHPDDVRAMGAISRSHVAAAAEIAAAGLRGQQLRKQLEEAEPLTRILFKAMRTSDARVFGSPASFAALRSRCIAVWHAMGPWTMAVNLNPSDLTSSIILELADKHHVYDLTSGPAADSRLPIIERLRILANNPIACATYFGLFVQAFCSVYLGWPIGQRRPDDQAACPFGHVIAYMFKDENNGRGSLHTHGLIMQPFLQPKHVEHVLADQHLRGHLLDFLDRTATQCMPEVPRAPTAAEIDLAQSTPLEDRHLCPQRAPELAANVAACAHKLQLHSHTSTCAKGQHEANDTHCRMAYPRPLCSETRVELTACVTQRRTHNMLVSYNPSLMLAHPCNQAINPFCEISRAQRDLQLFREKQQQPGGTQAAPPTLPTLEQAACDSAEYACKYATKADGTATNTAFLATALAAGERDPASAVTNATVPPATAPAAPPSDPALQGRTFLRKVLNRIHAAVVYPAPLAALHHLGYSDHTITHTTAYHPYQPHTRRLLNRQHDRETNSTQQPERVQHTQLADGTLRLVHSCDDYELRGSQLDLHSPYVMTALYEKVQIGSRNQDTAQTPQHKRKRGRPAQQRVSFQDDHPQHTTHELKRRAIPVLPQAMHDLPPRPPDDAAAAEKEAYACFALGNFCSDRDTTVKQDLEPGGTWWARFTAWEGSSNSSSSDERSSSSAPVQFARNILSNITSHSDTRARGTRQTHLRRQQQALALQLQPQAAAAPPAAAAAAEAAAADQQLASESDADAWSTDEHGEPDPDAPAPAEQQYVASLLDDAHFEQPQPPPSSLSTYIASSVHLLAGATFTAAPPTAATTHQPPLSQAAQLLKAARKAASDFSPSLVSASSTNSTTTTNSDQLHVLREGRAWRLDTLLTAPAGPSVLSSTTPPPYVRAAQPPSVRDTTNLFCLSPDQARPFVHAAHVLAAEARGEALPPLRMIIVGRPGTGKTRLLQAIEWWALQVGQSDNVVKTAYTWRASKQLDSPLSCGHSTCYTFGISTYHGTDSVPTRGATAERRAQFLGGSSRRLLVVDESSFLSGPHFAAMHTAAAASRLSIDTADTFGSHHLILCGDPCQHEPVPGHPLHDNSGGRPSSSRQRGFQLYRDIDSVYILTTQHRRTGGASPAAATLARYADMFDGLSQPTYQQVAAFVDALQIKTITDLDALAASHPRLVLLRNCVRSTLNFKLAAMHATHTERRVLVWPSTHSGPRGRALSDEELKLAIAQPSSSANGIPALSFYFDGARVAFTDNDAPEAGRINNNFGIARAIVLHPDEPQDPGHTPYRLLRHMPLAIFVEADGVQVGNLCGPLAPPNTIPIVPRAAQITLQRLPSPILTADGRSTTQLKASRHGFPLAEGNAVTDYFVQGMSFGADPWLLHLAPPPQGPFQRASVYVALTRHRSWDDVRLVSPLYNTPQEREEVIRKFHKLAAPHARLVAEMKRLSSLALASQQALEPLMVLYGLSAVLE